MSFPTNLSYQKTTEITTSKLKSYVEKVDAVFCISLYPNNPISSYNVLSFSSNKSYNDFDRLVIFLYAFMFELASTASSQKRTRVFASFCGAGQPVV